MQGAPVMATGAGEPTTPTSVDTLSRCYAYIVAYISRLEIGNVVLRPARLEVGHYDIGTHAFVQTNYAQPRPIFYRPSRTVAHTIWSCISYEYLLINIHQLNCIVTTDGLHLPYV